MVRPLERPHFVLGINSLVHFFAELPVLDISSLVESVINSSHSLLLHEPKIKLKRSQTQKQNKKKGPFTKEPSIYWSITQVKAFTFIFETRLIHKAATINSSYMRNVGSDTN